MNEKVFFVSNIYLSLLIIGVERLTLVVCVAMHADCGSKECLVVSCALARHFCSLSTVDKGLAIRMLAQAFKQTQSAKVC